MSYFYIIKHNLSYILPVVVLLDAYCHYSSNNESRNYRIDKLGYILRNLDPGRSKFLDQKKTNIKQIKKK